MKVKTFTPGMTISQREAVGHLNMEKLGLDVSQVLTFEPGEAINADSLRDCRRVVVVLVSRPEKGEVLVKSLPLPPGVEPVKATEASGYKAILARRAEMNELEAQLGPMGRLILARKGEQ